MAAQTDITPNGNRLHWFRHDLRLDDNPALCAELNSAASLLCVYIIENNNADYAPDTLCRQEVMGPYRQHFLAESLIDLSQQLQALGQDLLILQGDPLTLLPWLAKHYAINTLSLEAHCASNEKAQVKAIAAACPTVRITADKTATLYTDEVELPATFTPFRKHVEKYHQPITAIAAPNKLPAMHPLLVAASASLAAGANHVVKHSLPTDIAPVDIANWPQGPKNKDYVGGSKAAMAQINQYFWQTDRLATYKETRNGLLGWDFSSRLSAWLAFGCVSSRRVNACINEYEQQRTKNDSTYWLFFELLWREFFYWQHEKHGERFYLQRGVQNIPPPGLGNKALDHGALKAWCEGETGYAIVDAAMRELKHTGFMSNRARQLVASCFVHELGLDWRYGAAYFEYQLIDYDPASNYGNWQYLAGVGADARGHRQFNLDKQTQIYDPQGTYIAHWLSK